LGKLLNKPSTPTHQTLDHPDKRQTHAIFQKYLT
jgi:hypothetical protein